MSRLTEKNPNGKKLILKSGKVINHFSVLTESWMICDKLGKLEDLEEELNIDLLELLEDFKKTKEELKGILNKHPEITPDYMAYTLSNGITYRKLTEELGCPLKVVIKALKEGIVLENGKLYHCSLSFPKQKYSNEGYIFICYKNGKSVVGVSVEQYNKTWWLKGEKNETKETN